MAHSPSILVIKLGALGDFIQALGAMRAIRAHHPHADITLLTTPPFSALAAQSGYFNRVWDDGRPGKGDLPKLLRLVGKLRAARFTRVYDLQNSDRSAFYFYALHPFPPEWVGAAAGASHRNADKARSAGLAFDGHAQTLAKAGIANVAIDDMAWLRADLSGLALPAQYALLVPGCAPSRPAKRWPPEYFAQVARWLAQQGITPLLVGTKDDENAAHAIMQNCAQARSLIGRTKLFDLPDLARGAVCAAGNDTGPMHLIGASGCACVAVYNTRESNPVKHGILGQCVSMLSDDDITAITPDDVIRELQNLRSHHRPPDRNFPGSC